MFLNSFVGEAGPTGNIVECVASKCNVTALLHLVISILKVSPP